jgi:hypothetical protein
MRSFWWVSSAKCKTIEFEGGINMLRNVMFASAILVAALVPSYAKDLTVPAKDPVASISIPDSWDIDDIDFGYAAASPDEEMKLYVEYANASRVDKMLELNDQWMKEQEITPKGKPVEEDGSIGGLPAKMLTYAATDSDGDTIVEFVLLPGGKGRLILLTLWGSKEARAENQADIQAITASIKAIN